MKGRDGSLEVVKWRVIYRNEGGCLSRVILVNIKRKGKVVVVQV